MFVVQDFNFRWLSSFSSSSDQHTKEMALLFLVFPCGLIRGALANLGITAIVNADLTTLPGCTKLPFSSTRERACLLTLYMLLLCAQVYLTLNSKGEATERP